MRLYDAITIIPECINRSFGHSDGLRGSSRRGRMVATEGPGIIPDRGCYFNNTLDVSGRYLSNPSALGSM